MTRIRGKTLAEIQFQQNDNPPTRAQKLELIRAAIIALQAATPASTTTTTVVTGGYRIPGYFVETPAANRTLLLHSSTDDLYFLANFAGSQANINVNPAVAFVVDVIQNPVVTGLNITGGTLLGTLTFGTNGSVTWATVDGLPKQILKGEEIGLRAPSVADAAAAAASFTLYAEIGYLLNLLLFSGDQTDGDDIVKLSGDQSSGGTDFLLLSGDQQYG